MTIDVFCYLFWFSSCITIKVGNTFMILDYIIVLIGRIVSWCCEIVFDEFVSVFIVIFSIILCAYWVM